MEGDSLEAQVDALFKRTDARLHAFFNKIIEEMHMERQPQPEVNEQLTLFEVRSFLGRVAIVHDNVVYPQFGNWGEEFEHDPFIDDLHGLPTPDDIA